MKPIAVVVKGYPRLSETFIAQELLGLEKRGLKQTIISLRHPTDSAVHDMHKAIQANVLYLPEYLKDDPKRVQAGRDYALSCPYYDKAYATFQRDLARDRSANRWRRWGQACVLAHELPSDIEHIHVHYLHTPCSVTRYAAILRGLSWSFSAHAKDIWTTAEWDIREKLAECAWGVTCTAHNADYLRSLTERPNSIELIYHGLNYQNFPAAKTHYQKSPDSPFTILSVGRMVEKKGYIDLLHALAKLPHYLNWLFEHIGGGPLREKLYHLAEQLGIEKRIIWHGAQSRDAVMAANMRADLFVLPCIIAQSGDRDGIPNVLVEAQALGVPVISTHVSAISELIEHEKTGLLIDPGDRIALTQAIEQLAHNDSLRIGFGRAGAERTRHFFACQPGLDRLAEKLSRVS